MLTLSRRREQRLTILRSTELFSNCSLADLRRIDSLTMQLDVPRGTVLVREGHRALEFFVVVEGTATATRDGLWLAQFGAGSFFGETALLDRGVRTATITADTDMSVLVASMREFSALHTLVPSIATKMNIELSRRIRSTDELLDQESVCAPDLRPVVVFGAPH